MFEKIKAVLTEQPNVSDWISEALGWLDRTLKQHLAHQSVRTQTRISADPDLVNWFIAEVRRQGGVTESSPASRVYVYFVTLPPRFSVLSIDLIRIVYMLNEPFAIVLSPDEDFGTGQGKVVRNTEELEEVVSRILENNKEFWHLPQPAQ
jgi:hypothetical protein